MELYSGHKIWTFLPALLVVVSSLNVTDAAAAVSFQFLLPFSSIQADVDNFISQLTTDLRTKYSFSSQNIASIMASPGNEETIQINFDLSIDTRNASQVAQRDTLGNDLSTASYIFVYTNSSGARTAFLVDGPTASVTPSFWDGWHQSGSSILFAVLAGLLVVAVFCVLLYCITSRKRRHKLSVTRSVSHGLDNPAFTVEMSDMYMTQHSEVTPIPHQENHSITSFSMLDNQPIQRPTQELTPVTPTSINSSPQTVQINSASAEKSGSAPTRGKLRPKLDNPTLELVKKQRATGSLSKSTSSMVKPPASPKTGSKSAGLYGSVRSWSSILGASINSTPASSRRASKAEKAEPTMYERLIYASYSVPPRKSHDFL